MPPKAAKAEVPTKVSMVRSAIAALGYDSRIDEYVSFISKQFGQELTKACISVTKSVEKKRVGLGKQGRKKKDTAAAVPPVSAAPAPSVSDLLTFHAVVLEWERKLGGTAFREVLKAASK